MTDPTTPGNPGIRVRMRARDTTEKHRASTPLELLFDLTFVVAISQLAARLAHEVEGGHALEGLPPFLMVFFAVWWAWMNFTWMASAYDSDDVLYRVLTVVQMFGVLVLAAGVPAAFDGQFTAVTTGYVIMRLGLVGLWVRATIEHPATRAVTTRYAIGILIVQAGWVLRLLLPPEAGVVSFIVLGLFDLAVPIWAEWRRGGTAWHPHHIAERYGLFTIILLGEGVLAATNAVAVELEDGGVTGDLILVAAAGLVIVVGLWWLYFSEPAGDALARRRERSFVWGYGHYLMFAALTAVGAGLEVVVVSLSGHLEIDDAGVGLAIAIPVAAVLILIWALHAPLVDRNVLPLPAVGAAAVAVLLLPQAAPAIGVAGVVAAIALVLIVMVGVAVRLTAREARRALQA